MSKNQVSFAIAGLIFGFLVGFVVAHQMYAGRGEVAGFQHPPIPAGMGGGAPVADRPGGQPAMPPMAGGAPMAGGGDAGAGGGATAGGDTATMQQIQREVKGLKDLLEKDPKNLQALTRMGDIYFDAGMFDKSKGFYEQALGLNPGDVNLRTDYGTCLRNLGQIDEALKNFEATVAADPKHWKGWFNIGIVALYDLGDYDRAQRAFDKVSELSPGAIDMSALQKEIARVKAEKASGGGRS